jgi:predicted unusual protein kinase regulating ubiquinone biosynthesis (AarF/ABC1/UbiB family)
MSRRAPSRISRLARLGGLTGRISSSYIGERVRDAFRGRDQRKEALDRLHVDNAELVVETLGRLKGAAMKVGQGMAMAAQTLDLPEDVSKVLGQLHAKAEPVPFDDIRESVEAELEKPIEDAFAEFDPRPVGTASLGQAHAARLPDGTEVVVKVLHYGVERSVDTDLLALKTVFLGSRVLRRERAEVDAAFDEVRERLSEELDYLQEAANIAIFQQIFGQDPRVHIPRVHPHWCTERVLTMDRMRGEPLDVFLETSTREARQQAGVTLASLYYEMAFHHRTLHADPHPGNYLFDPEGRVSLLDFGCVKRFDEFWIANYARAALSALDGDREGLLEHVRRIDGWHGNSPGAADVLWRFADTLSQPYRAGLYTIGDHQDSIIDRLKPIIAEMVRYPELTIPRDLIYLHRSLGGLYSIARRLVVTSDWGALLREHTSYAIARAEGRLTA